MKYFKANPNNGTNVNAAPFIPTPDKQRLPTIDEDQKSTYSTTSSLTLSTLSSLSATSITINQNQITFSSINNTVVTQLKLHVKNLTKKSIFIAREKIELINQHSFELFDTNQKDDMGLCFSYIKESIAMSINDKLFGIYFTVKGEVLILNIDLHFKDGKIMYLIGILNDPEYVKKGIPWKIVTIMCANTIYKNFGITQDRLPKSCRNMEYFINGLRILSEYVPRRIIWQTNFKNLCKKESKLKNKSDMREVNVSEHEVKYWCDLSWNNGIFLPVVFIAGKKNYIEMKKFVRIFDDENGDEQWIGLSLRYHSANKQWKIACLDFDAGRVFYQFRLVGNNHSFRCSYNDLSKLVNTKLNIN